MGLAFKTRCITDDLNGPGATLCEKDMILTCDSEGPGMNLNSLRNILTNFLNWYFSSYKCSKVLSDKNLCPDKPKRVLSISQTLYFNNKIFLKVYIKIQEL